MRTPGRLLDVAERLFAERGYAAVALKDIVRAAGVNGAAVNYHFGDKRALYRKVIERGLETREQAAPLEAPAHAALRANAKLHYDAAAMRVTNNTAANDFLTREYRAPFVVPAAGKV